MNKIPNEPETKRNAAASDEKLWEEELLDRAFLKLSLKIFEDWNSVEDEIAFRDL